MKLDAKKRQELLEFENNMSAIFIERYLSELEEKNPKEIIQAYTKWRYSRYTVVEEEKMFFVIDIDSPGLPVVTIIKEKDPDAFNHAWTITEMLNNLPNNVCSIDGRAFEYDDVDFHTSQETLSDIFGSSKYPEPLNCEPSIEDFTIDNVINNNINKKREEE